MRALDLVLAGELPRESELIGYVRGRRWFGAKAHEIAHARVVETAALRSTAPALVASIAEVRFPAGTHELYQLPLGIRPLSDGWRRGVICEAEGCAIYDALLDPELARELVALVHGQATASAREGIVEFRSADDGLDALPEPRLLAAEQSNTSVVFGDELILKAYRRLEAGVNPELELLRFLTGRRYPNVAELKGWYAYNGAVMDLTLGIVQRFLGEGEDGWELALAELSRQPDRFLERLRRLGEVTGSLHAVLASDANDPDFAPEEPSGEGLALLVATVDEEIEAVFLDLPEGLPALEPIRGRGEEVRERLRVISHVGDVGRIIRTHGDYHLGQVLCTGDDWVVLDFEGEPARSLPERRRKRSPLRDVAGMLRSFAYVSSAAQPLAGVSPPAGWEERARERFLEGYLDTVDRHVLPGSAGALERLLTVFELEKAVYELRYELNNRPDWLAIPVAGIERLLEQPV
ncbi:MAG: phosphotransferase [Thermoleophilia bacterium]|nr:phosphotransferase [Thermoleophilia bacterium]